VREILSRTAIEKVRISSVEPMDWSSELIAMMASSSRIAKHAHVPMQSGSDRVLRAMHRKYRPWHYRERIFRIREAMPKAAIGADVMVGFPGETDADFEDTRRMIEDLPLTYLHVFTYSARPGTPAAGMRGQVPPQVARDRNRVLRDLAAEKKSAFMRSFLGQTVETITLHSQSHVSEADSFTETLTENYLRLQLRGEHASNHWVSARVECVEGDILIGTLAGDAPSVSA
jgi:threonylcarbamoyladenosine tRNA methylthiotransferase MtaB